MGKKIPLWVKIGIVGAIYGIFVSFMPFPLAFLTYPLFLILSYFATTIIGVSWMEYQPCKILFLCSIPFVMYSVIFYAIIGVMIGLLIKKISKIGKKPLSIILFLIVYFSIFNSVHAENLELPSIIVNLNILNEIRKPVSYPGIIEIINIEQTKPIKLNKLLIYKSDKLLYQKFIDKNLIGVNNEYETFQNLSKLSYQGKMNMNLTELFNKLFQGIHIEEIIINPNEIFENGEFESGSEKNIKIIIELSDENKKYKIEKDLVIRILELLPKNSSYLPTDEISENKIGPLSIPNAPSGWYYGDLHLHSGYSTISGYDGNYWTFGDNCGLELTATSLGNTIPNLKSQAEALDLSWFSITDHSYCLDSNEWNNVVSECSDVTNSNFLCLPSEELSVSEDCASLLDEGCGYAAHLGAHGISSFIEQSGGILPVCPSNPGTQEGINLINSQNGFSIINHPKSSSWDCKSINCIVNENGLEIWNADWSSIITHNQDALNLWVSLLLKGKKIFAFGGTDSHTNANDIVYNGVYLQNFNTAGLKDALKNGRSFVSNNGFLTFEIKGESDINWKKLGGELNVYSGEEITISINYNVFDKCHLQLKKGYINSNEFTKEDYGYIKGSGSFTFYDSNTYKNGYFRVECINETANKRIYTNPIWLNIQGITTSTTTTTTTSTTTTTITGKFYPYNQEINITDSLETKIGYVTPHKITIITDCAYLSWRRYNLTEGSTLCLVEGWTIPLPFGFDGQFLYVKTNDITPTGVDLTIDKSSIFNVTENMTKEIGKFVDVLGNRTVKFVNRGYYSSLHVTGTNDYLSQNLTNDASYSEALLAEKVTDKVIPIVITYIILPISGPFAPIIKTFIINNGYNFLIGFIPESIRHSWTNYLLNIQTMNDTCCPNDNYLSNKGVFTIYFGNPEKNKLSKELNDELKSSNLPHFEQENGNWIIKGNRTYREKNIGIVAAIPQEKFWNNETLVKRWNNDTVRLYKTLIAGIDDNGTIAAGEWYNDQLELTRSVLTSAINLIDISLDSDKLDVFIKKVLKSDVLTDLANVDPKAYVSVSTLIQGWIMNSISLMQSPQMDKIDSLGYVAIVKFTNSYNVVEMHAITGNNTKVLLGEYIPPGCREVKECIRKTAQGICLAWKTSYVCETTTSTTTSTTTTTPILPDLSCNAKCYENGQILGFCLFNPYLQIYVPVQCIIENGVGYCKNPECPEALNCLCQSSSTTSTTSSTTTTICQKRCKVSIGGKCISWYSCPTTTTISTTTIAISSTSTIKTTTTTISACSGKSYVNCRLFPDCQWIGDNRIGKCVPK